MARQRYYGEKFKPTKGAFGNKSKYQKSLERQAELKKQIAEFEEKQKADAQKKLDEKSTTEEKEKQSKTDNVDDSTKS